MAQAYQYHDAPMSVEYSAHEAPIALDYDDGGPGTYGGQKVVVPPDALGKQYPSPTTPAKLPSTSSIPICGLRRRTFYSVLAVVGILLLGAIAGLAGGLVSQRNRANADNSDATNNDSSSGPLATSPSSTSPSASPLASSILDDSQLATAKWANETGTASFVVYQDGTGSLMLANWHTVNATWRSVNITDRMRSARSPIRPKPGTPIACVTSSNSHVVVLFVDKDNIVRGVHTQRDGDYMAWKHSELYGPGESWIPADAQSRLAGFWLWCPQKCQESEEGQKKVQIFLETEPGKIESYIDKTMDSDFSAAGRAGSALAITPSVTASGERRMILFFDAGEKLGMMRRKSADESTWVEDEAFSGETHPTFPGQQIAAGSFAVDRTDDTASPEWAILAVQLEKDGSLSATYWDPRTQEWTFGSPVELAGGPQPPPAFKAIAMNFDRRFYGIADGAILEYRVDRNIMTRFIFTATPVTP